MSIRACCGADSPCDVFPCCFCSLCRTSKSLFAKEGVVKIACLPLISGATTIPTIFMFNTYRRSYKLSLFQRFMEFFLYLALKKYPALQAVFRGSPLFKPAWRRAGDTKNELLAVIVVLHEFEILVGDAIRYGAEGHPVGEAPIHLNSQRMLFIG